MSTAWPLCPDTTAVAFLGHEIQVHPLMAGPLRVVELRAWRSAYGVAFAEGLIGPTPTGFANCRNRRPYPEQPVTWDRHSEHAHAIAGDIDYDSNPLSSTGYLVTDFDRFGYEDGVDWLRAWLEPPSGLRALFRWGGGWTTSLAVASRNLARNGERIRDGVVDGMHFELALTPAETQAYDWKAAIAEEDAMNKEIQAAIDFLNTLRKGLKPGAAAATPVGAGRRVAAAVVKLEKTKATT